MRKERKIKIISSILVISIILSIFMPIFSNANEQTIDEGVVYTLDTDATQLVEGTQITINMYIDLENGKSVDTFSGFLTYDNTVLEFDTSEEFITSSDTRWNFPDYVDNNGTIQIETTRSNANSSKTGLMYTMVFNVLKTVDSTIISLDSPINSAYMGVDIWSNGYELRIPKVSETYSIIYNSNTTDNIENMPSQGVKVEDVDYIIATAPTRTGYTFKGWNTQADGNGTSYLAGATYSANEDVTLYAQWEAIQTILTVNPNGGVWEGSSNIQTFTEGYGTTKTINNPTSTPNGNIIRFNSNGGTVTPLQITQTTTFNGWEGTTLAGTTYTFGTSNATLTAKYAGDSITLPTATKTGTSFLGWYDLQGNYIGTAGDTYSPAYTTPNAIIPLTAKYEGQTYTLTIDANGGTYSGSTSIQGTYNSEVTVNEPTKTGFVITLDNNDETEVTTSVTQTYKFSEWEVISGDGTISGTTYKFGTQNGEIKANYTPEAVELPEPTRAGYTFTGWYTSATGGTKINSPYIPTSDITLYAQWTKKIYTITFNPGENGTVDTTTKQVTYNAPYGELPVPTRPGFEFNGWYDANNNKIEESDIVDITSDITLTAKWLGAEYTITFDPDGGEVDVTSKTVKNEGTYGELPEASKEGYDFIGWFDQNGNKVESTDIVNATSDITLKAGYETKKYFITFKNDDGTEIKTIKVEHGTDATFTGDLPEKSEVADGYEAKFTGWDNEQALKNVTGDVTVTATYEVSPIVYTITYYNIKTADNSSNPTTYTIEDNNFDLKDLEDQGKYIFLGWYTSNEENAEKVTSIDTSKLGNIVLYAKWYNDELYLASEKYKVGENDIDNYEDGDIYLDKIEPETTVSELIANCDTNGIITVINENGEILEEDDLVGTNMTIKVTKDDKEITLTTVVMGDLNGDGKVTATDLSTLNQTMINRKTLEEVRFKAADLDDNEKLTATDLSTINQTILETIELTYNKDSIGQTSI